eukprot:scaffold8188_cov793-Prasinococcus_capsulatus_cf.AAC.1
MQKRGGGAVVLALMRALADAGQLCPVKHRGQSTAASSRVAMVPYTSSTKLASVSHLSSTVQDRESGVILAGGGVVLYFPSRPAKRRLGPKECPARTKSWDGKGE